MSKLDEPVTIHFKEDSIPSLRRGVLTDEAKQEIKDVFLELIGEDEEGEIVQVECPDLKEGCLVYHTDFKMTHGAKNRNYLRQELRQKVEEL